MILRFYFFVGIFSGICGMIGKKTGVEGFFFEGGRKEPKWG